MTKLISLSALFLLLSPITPVWTAPASSFDGAGILISAGQYGVSKIEDLGLSQAHHLFARQAEQSCENRCKRSCKYSKIRAQPSCRCVCPPKTKAQGKICVPDVDSGGDCPSGKQKNDKNECVDKPEDCPLGKQKNDKNECVDKPKDTSKEDKYQEKKKVEKKKWLDGKKERDAKKKAKAYEKKRAVETQKYKAREQERNDRKRKTGRMGKCILLVTVVLGVEEAEQLSDNYFSEDVLTSRELDQYWPSDVPLDSAIDDKLDTDEYTDQWAEDLEIPDNLDVPDDPKRRSLPAETANSYESPHKKVKRFFWALIPAIVGAAARIGTAVASAGSRIAAIAARGFRITKAGAQKVSKSDQLKTIGDKIAKNKNWQKCLRGEKPSK
ncbi:MAG: hypothetical protein LQ337_007634 [Flavoplaca oasis]|nr:MAG: hypothetical protein LQ337_007634 [Flavoplaca oasis]